MRRRRFRSQRKSMYISLVILFFVFMSIGYSYLSKTLNVSGNIAVSKTTWDVHFANAEKTDGNLDASPNFTYTDNNTNLSLGLSFTEPGDFFEFEVDVVNNGTINAMLGSIIQDDGGVLTQNGRNNYLEYTITYDDGIPLTVKDSLPKKTSDKLKVRIAFKENVQESQLPSNDDNFQVTFKTTYVQDDGTSRDREVAGARMLIKKANASNTTYAGVGTEKQTEMFAFNHTSPVAKTDYRYIGKTPNNYITFNGEEWRIIGVFDGKIKLIRSLGIDSTDVNNPTSIIWDYKYSSSTSRMVGTSQSKYGSNDWSDAQLMYLLNKQDIDKVLKVKTNYTKTGNLIKDANGNVIYELGKKPSQQTYGLATYTGGNGTTGWTGLTEAAYNQVAAVTWNLGGVSINQSVENCYVQERGTTTCYNSTTISNANRCLVERPTTWTGKIGLMYPSDYGYTFGKGINSCISDLYNCNSNPTSSWLYISNESQWTLSPSFDFPDIVLYVDNTGTVANYGGMHYSRVVRPCVYLKSDIKLQGSGTITNPYTIAN